MFDDIGVKHAALDKITSMLKDGQAKRIKGLVEKPEEKKPSLEIHVIKAAAAPEGEPDGDEAETDGDAAAPADAAEPSSLHALVMKHMDKLIRPKKSKE